MNAWYKFILNVLFSKKSENKDWEMTDEEEDILANYIELDYHAKETEPGS